MGAVCTPASAAVYSCLGAYEAAKKGSHVYSQIVGDDYSTGVLQQVDNSPLVACRYCKTSRKASKDNCPSCAGRGIE